MKLIFKNNKWNAIYSQKALCDFIGIYNKKFILIEAKTITQRFEFRRLKSHQIIQLKRINDLGGISIILFEFVQENIVRFIYINNYLNHIDNMNIKSKSISKQELEKVTERIDLSEIEKIFN